MSAREERLVLAASALVALGRDDRLQPDAYAERAIRIADAMIAQLDATAPEEDSDGDLDAYQEALDHAYEEGVRDTEARYGQLQTEAFDRAKAALQKEAEEKAAAEAAAKQQKPSK